MHTQKLSEQKVLQIILVDDKTNKNGYQDSAVICFLGVGSISISQSNTYI